MRRNCAAYTLLEIMIVVGVIGMLAVIAVPRFIKARTTAQQSVCLSNLRQIDSAKTMHALEDRKRTGEAVDPGELDPFLRSPFDTMTEPASGQYDIQEVGYNPLCSVGGGHAMDPADAP
jgi:prepilin-type N-terminal cleavage/methylation domain-containing protein